MLLPLLAACMGGDGALEEELGASFTDVKVRIHSAPDTRTRSSVGTAEDGINDYILLFYEDGLLLPELTVRESAAGAESVVIGVSLGIGHEFDIVSFANCTVSPAPQTLAEARALCYDCDGVSGWTRGIPMAGYKTLKVRYHMPDVEMQLVRLAARLDLSIDTSSLQHGSITFTSIAVRQMNRSCPFFASGSASPGGGVCDGDSASAADLDVINASPAGCRASFYLLENMQGDILAGNTDPDRKVPSSVQAAGSDPGLCTYLEICGTYTDRSGHMTSDNLVSHLYLGADALANFDIERNHRYEVSVVITDNGCLRTDWKINGYLDDNRLLAFDAPTLKIGKAQTKTAVLNTNLSLPEGDYSYEITGDVEDITAVPSAQGFTVTSSARVRNGQSILITATSWDGALSTSCAVTAEIDPRFTLEWSDTLYVAQKVKIKIRDKKGENLDNRVRLYVSNDYVSLEGRGDTWYVSGLNPGFDEITLAFEESVVDYFRVDVLQPELRFASSRIALPLDGTQVACGPYFHRIDGTRMRYDEFDPGLYASLLGFTLTREHNSNYSGRYWSSQGSAGSPVVGYTNTGGAYDSYSFYINRLSYGGRHIQDNYRFNEGPADLERITATMLNPRLSILDASAVLYTEDPFAEQCFLGSVGSWALAYWGDYDVHDDTVDYWKEGLLASGYDCGYAFMALESGSGNYDFTFPDRNTLRLTAHYNDYGVSAMPPYQLTLVPKILNRYSHETYESWKRFTARCTVNLCVGGVLTAKSSGTWDVSLEWTFPRPSTGPLASLEDIVVGTGYNYVRGLYTPLYSVSGDKSAIQASVMPSYQFIAPGAALTPGNMSNSDSYAVPLSASQGYRFVVWRYSNLYPGSNGWIDK